MSGKWSMLGNKIVGALVFIFVLSLLSFALGLQPEYLYNSNVIMGVFGVVVILVLFYYGIIRVILWAIGPNKGRMNKKQLVIAWVMANCIFYVLSCIYVVRGITPIEQQPLRSRMLGFVHDNIFMSLFLVLILGGLLIYTLRSQKK